MRACRVTFVASAVDAASGGPYFVEAVYTRLIESAAKRGLPDLPKTFRETVRGALDAQLRGALELPDVADDSTIDLNFLAGNGAVRLTKTIARKDEPVLEVRLVAGEVKTVTAPDPTPEPAAPQTLRRAYFVAVSAAIPPYELSKLQIAPVRVADGGWHALELDRMFHSESPATSSVPWNDALSFVASVAWTEVHVTVDGQFSFTVPSSSGDAWLWWLSGPLPAMGIVLDDLSATKVTRVGVALPPFAASTPTDSGTTRVPTDVTEGELVDNPDVYTEDPGEFCKPFKNPERVLGERSFFVIFRVEQPVISAEASVKKDPLPVLTSVLTAPLRDVTGATLSTAAAARAPASGAIIDGETESTFLRHTLPAAYLDLLGSLDRGRTEMDAAHPVQWEGDSSRYQATTVSRGHIIEFRMRWRSNGYSLGTVAKTLTLAPRQAKRIEKIEWSRSELSRRVERTELADQVSDSLSRSRDYDDSVQANLSEWARGSSSSNMVSGAAGFGFVVPPFVVGGGGGGSHASSESSQEGGRQTSASEEQRLRDSIRRYGDSLRKFDSMVVNEVTQEESATGTTEIVRNLNYGHSLTVIYYQILRHLKIETGVAGVRECLFVPFSITPFTVARAYRWRESIDKGLRDRQYGNAIKYLKDVLTGFANSSVPPGRRSDQPVRFVRGSLFVSLAIDRPRDKDDGGFDAVRWALVQPFLGTPALGIFNLLHAVDEAQRDALFQKQQAGIIAANWVNTLTLDVGGPPLRADFTLATRYQFNGVVRVDFTVAVPEGSGVTRESLSSLRVKATKDLPPGSVANVQGASFTYQTDQYQRSVTVSMGSDDLIDVESGVRDSLGARLASMPDEWERRDVRAEMIAAVQSLVEHLNEHVEYYHKCIWWNLDRDRLFMLIDGFYVPGTNQVSIASVVERDPIAIVGNAIVFRVSAGSFLGLGSLKTPADLLNYYVAHDAPSEPMLISLPTDGLYAQTVMDDCPALEEHFGNTDWALNDPDPTLSDIAPELLASRRAEPQGTQPTQLPQTIINLQNAPDAPAPSGLGGALSAVTNANAFRDMAGLAGTQANAATAFQTAASLAQNFGNQAAALKLAELAKDAHATQTADQKLATVQRAADKQLVSPEVAQQHASQILDSLHSPTQQRPHQDPVLSQAVFAAAGQPGSTIQATTPEGQLLVSLASNGGGGATAATPKPTAPPNPVKDLPLGFDISQDNGNQKEGLTEFVALKDAGKVFGIAKVGQYRKDDAFDTRYPLIRDAGMLRGSYDFFAPIDVDTQIQLVIDHVKRLTPGDIAPALDLEDQSGVLDKKYKYSTTLAGRQSLFNDVSRWLTQVETQLGRSPIMYTGVIWREQFTQARFPALPDMSVYPLWTAHPLPVEMDDTATGEVFNGWSDFTFWQYGEDKRGAKKKGEKDTKFWGIDPYFEPGTERFDGIDYDAFNGSMFGLRGLADLAHTAPHVAAGTEAIAFTDNDGKVHLAELVGGAWQDHDLSNVMPADASGDPAAVATNTEQVILYRTAGGAVIALTRALGGGNTSFTAATVATDAIADPFVMRAGNDLHAVFWDTHDQQIHLFKTGSSWQHELAGDPNVLPPPPDAAGSAITYVYQNAVHVAGRGGGDGHLFDLFNANGGNPSEDFTSTASDANGQSPPAATYRPTLYTPAAAGAAPRIVFRAVRGAIWQVERDTLKATNLTAAANAPVACGSPSAIVTDRAHILFRGTDRSLNELFEDAGAWRTRRVCAGIVADPTAYVDRNGNAAVSFFADDGLKVARLANGAWACENVTAAGP